LTRFLASTALLASQTRAVPFDTPLFNILDPSDVRNNDVAPIIGHHTHNPSASKLENVAAASHQLPTKFHPTLEESTGGMNTVHARDALKEEKEDGYFDELFRTVPRPEHPFNSPPDRKHDRDGLLVEFSLTSRQGKRPGPKSFPRRQKENGGPRHRKVEPNRRPPPPDRPRRGHEDHSQLPPPPTPRFPLYPGVGRPPFESIPPRPRKPESPSLQDHSRPRHDSFHPHHGCHDRPRSPHSFSSSIVHRFLRISHHPFFHVLVNFAQLALAAFVIVKLWKSWKGWKNGTEGRVRLEEDEEEEKGVAKVGSGNEVAEVEGKASNV